MKKIFVLLVLTTNLFVLSAQSPIYFEPSGCEWTLAPGDSAVVHSVLHNATDHTTEFYFPGYTSKDQGGPDGYGYSWIDSDEPNGPEWAWTDISENGYLIEGLGDDQVAGPYEMGFGFPFYGQTKNTFWVSSNGAISFNDQFLAYSNSPIPTNSNYVDFIAWFWDDLTIDTAITSVYFKNYGEKTIVQFNKMVHYPGTDSFITAQVMLIANGTILIRYKQVSSNFVTTSATVGLQSWNPQMGLQVAYNEEYIHSELAVRFDLNRNFITSVSPSSLVLLPDTQETIWITYSAVGYESGNYEQDLKCITSHPEYPYLILPNFMLVTNQEQSGFKGYVTDAATGYAINDAKVQVGEHYVFTNDNGYYELPLEQGSYNVKFLRNGYQTLIVEDTTALPGFSILDVELSALYFLAGRVFAGDNPIESGFAYGYKMVEETVVDIFAGMVGELGWYDFSGLSSAHYIVKTEPSPNSVYYGNYLPTYYGDVLHWEDATVINLVQSTESAHINLLAAVSAPQGPGSISGTIANSNRAAEIAIFLKTVEQGAVVMTLSQADGSYSFTGLAYGTYEVFAEITGKSITPLTIVLDVANPLKENVDMLVAGNEIIFTGIQESEVFDMMPNIYPVPARDKFNVKLGVRKPAVVDIQVLDACGRMVYRQDYSVAGHDDIMIDPGNIPIGVFMVRIEVGGEVVVRRIIRY